MSDVEFDCNKHVENDSSVNFSVSLRRFVVTKKSIITSIYTPLKACFSAERERERSGIIDQSWFEVRLISMSMAPKRDKHVCETGARPTLGWLFKSATSGGELYSRAKFSVSERERRMIPARIIAWKTYNLESWISPVIVNVIHALCLGTCST